MLGQPASRHQTSQRPVRANHVHLDVAAIARDDIVEVLLVRERQRGEVVHCIALAALGPVDDATHLVTVDEDMDNLQVTVDEHRGERPQRRLGDPTIAPDYLGGHDIVGDEPLALRVE